MTQANSSAAADRTKLPDFASKEALSPVAVKILDRLEMWGLKLGLERIRETLEALGRPDRDFPIVLIGGTNGKGSTAAMLASIASAAGYRTGLFTSPHLQSVRERIRVDGHAISAEHLSNVLERVADASQRNRQPLPSYFEAVTASALLHFSQQRVELGVLEVGLGGRLDATNATEPILSVITSIAHDHQEHLGHTLELIAREKAGIARVGKPLLAWAPGQSGVQRVLQELRDRGVAVEDAWRGLSVSRSPGTAETAETAETTGKAEKSDDAAPPTLSVTSTASPPQGTRTYQLQTPLRGVHQDQNTALAVRAAEHLATLGFESIDDAAIRRGVERCNWPGRLERVVLTADRTRQQQPAGSDEPYPTRPPTPIELVLLDGAHNLAGARALARELARKGAPSSAKPTCSQPTCSRPALLFASLKGKGAAKALRVLAEHVGPIVLSAPTSHRAKNPWEIKQALERVSPEIARRCQVVDSFAEALDIALLGALSGASGSGPSESKLADEPDTLVICGSLYAVGEARTLLYQRYGKPLPAADINLFAAQL